MQTKLTLRLDDRLIQNAKRFSRRTGKSVSQLVADFFTLIDVEEETPDSYLTPRVRALVGSLRGAEDVEEGYRRHLEEKYQ